MDPEEDAQAQSDAVAADAGMPGADAEDGGLPVLAADFSNIDELVEAAIKAATEAASDETDDAEPVAVAADTTTADEDEAAALAARLAEKGYRVEAPAPPPDPMDALHAELAPLVGEAAYQAHLATLRRPLPPEPDSFAEDDEPEVVAYREAKQARDAATAALERMDQNRTLANKVYAWARRQALADHGEALAALPKKYQGIDAAAVTNPDSLEPVFAAVEKAVEKRLVEAHKAEIAKLKAAHQRQLAAAEVDGVSRRHDQMAGAPAAVIGGGRALGDGPFSIPTKTVNGFTVADEDFIARAMRGEFAGAR